VVLAGQWSSVSQPAQLTNRHFFRDFVYYRPMSIVELSNTELFRAPFYPDIETIVEEIYAPNGEYERAFGKHEVITSGDVIQYTNSLHTEMYRLETAALEYQGIPLTPDLAKQIKLFIRYSGSGTYYQPVKNDKYYDKAWANNLDRIGADAAAVIGIKAAGLATGKDFSQLTAHPRFPVKIDDLAHIAQSRQAVHESITSAGVRFLYTGREDETTAINGVLSNASAFIPKAAVDVRIPKVAPGQEINTFTQTVDLKKYLEMQKANGLLRQGDRIALVSFVPQAIRILRMMQQLDAIPKNIQLSVVPLATPQNGLPEYPLQEIKDTMYYIFTGKAATKSPEYSVITT